MANTYVQLPVLPRFSQMKHCASKILQPQNKLNPNDFWRKPTESFSYAACTELPVLPVAEHTPVWLLFRPHVSFNSFYFLISCSICRFIFACSDVADRKAFQQHSSRSVDSCSNWGILRATRKSSQNEVSPEVLGCPFARIVGTSLLCDCM